MDYKQIFLNRLSDCYETLDWERDNQELTSTFGGYKIRIDSTRDGVFLQVIPKGDCLGKTISAKEYPTVADIRRDIWDMLVKKSDDIFWRMATDGLPIEK